MKNTSLFALVLLSVLPAFSERITSPGGEVALDFSIANGEVLWSLETDGKCVVQPSALGHGGVSTCSSETKTGEDTAQLLWGERPQLTGEFTSGKVLFDGEKPFALEVFVHAHGAAFRYDTAVNERTEFRFPEGTRAWAIAKTEDLYPVAPIPLAEISNSRMLPLTAKLPDGSYACILEADALHYSRAKLKGDGKGNLAIALPEKAGETKSPWRAVIIAKNAAQLAERNDFVLRLNAPHKGDFGWVKTGLAVSNEANCPLRMAELEKLVDFAQYLGAKYVQLDWGWYGTEWPWGEKERETFRKTRPDLAQREDWVVNTRADPTRVAKGLVPYLPHWKNNITDVDLDIPALVEYGRQRGIGICLYVRAAVMENRDLDELFALYESWGIVGLKPGFVKFGSAWATDWNRKLVEAAARHHLWVDIHDAYVPDGFQRTFPNLLINEGGGGQEWGGYPSHQELVHPFVRCMAGGQDFTPLFYRNGITSRLHQIAIAACLNAPTAVVRGGLAKRGEFGEEISVIRFLGSMSWDETRVLTAEPGKYILVAHRRGKDWLLNGMASEAACAEISVALDFLADNKEYYAEIYRDAPAGGKAVRETCTLSAKDLLNASMSANGGFAAILRERDK